MKEVALGDAQKSPEAATFAACVATILELSLEEVPQPAPGQDPATGWAVSRWLGGMGLGLVPVADAATFSWPGPWVARVQSAENEEVRYVVMYGVPSGVVYDPAGAAQRDGFMIIDGYVIAPGDVALVRPPEPPLSAAAGAVESIWVASAAGDPARPLRRVLALPGLGLDGDRHATGTGTFPSGLPGSALTLIEAEVCESFDPPLLANEHRRNVVTRGIDLNPLVGRDFSIGAVRCRGVRLCEPCRVIARYAGRPVIRPLVHRGGLRADILGQGVIAVGDAVSAAAERPQRRQPSA